MAQLDFHHVGIACRRLASERESYLALGFKEEGPVFEDPRQQIRGQFLTQGSFRVELLEPTTPESPVHAHLRAGVKMYHQAFTVAALGEAIAELQKTGAHVVVPPTPAVAFGGRSIAFLMLRTTMLIELIESGA